VGGGGVGCVTFFGVRIHRRPLGRQLFSVN